MAMAREYVAVYWTEKKKQKALKKWQRGVKSGSHLLWKQCSQTVLLGAIEKG